MKSENRIFLRLSVLLLPLLLLSCAVNPVTGQRELMLVSQEQELEIGKESAPSLQWEFGGYYRDNVLESYLGSIVKRLWSISERPNMPVSFHIQNTSLPNAFALPGNVGITRGLICSLENEAQFAAVIGHEIGHVMARHTAQKLSRMTLQQLGLSIGAAALDGSSGSDVLLQAGAIGSSLLLLKYDREQEIQADRLGVKYMARLGYDPREAVSAHGVLEKTVDDYLKKTGKSRRGDDAISQLLSTHPRTEVRIHEIQAMINELPPYSVQGDGRFSGRFHEAIKKISGTNKIYFIYDEAENYYQKKNFSAAEEQIKKAIGLDDSQPPFYNLLGLINLQRKDYKEAENAFRKAVSLDDGYQPSLYGLGVASYFREDYGKAADYFKKSISLFPAHAQSHLGLGKSYFLIHKYGDAIPYLRNFSGAAPRHAEVHGLLGICYEKTGDVKSAVIEYGNQLKVAPDNELGRFARNRLVVLSPGSK